MSLRERTRPGLGIIEPVFAVCREGPATLSKHNSLNQEARHEIS